MPRYPTPPELKTLYAVREKLVAAAAARGVVNPADLTELDRLGRCSIASDHWTLCTAETRTALLEDKHHFVRACADISQLRESRAS